MSRIVTRNGVYFGAKAKTKEIREAGPDSQREIRRFWVDKAVGQAIEYPAGTITSRTVVGNERRGTFRVLIAEHVTDVF